MKIVTASVIAIGNELLIGQVIDTNSAWLSSALNKTGIWVHRKVIVGDEWNAIWQALDAEAAVSDIIILTGGLGPTADDITKPLLCEYFQSELIVNEDVLQHIQSIFEKLKRSMLEADKKLAELPHNCKVLPNSLGMAPGMWFEKNNKIFISLPGVPYEMRAITEEQVIPKLQNSFHLPAIEHRTLLLAEAGESLMAARLKNFEAQLPAHIKLAYLPQLGLLRLRLTVWGTTVEEVKKEADYYSEKLYELVQDKCIAKEDITMETLLGKLLNEKKKTVATAESCTGGYIAHLLTSNPKSSSFFTGSVVCYSARIKSQVLGVSEKLLQQEGTVAEEVAKQLALGILHLMQSDYAIAVTGLMGPDDGGEHKPVGTVWIAVGNKEKIKTKHFLFRFNRKTNIEVTAMNAMNELRKFILENE